METSPDSPTGWPVEPVELARFRAEVRAVLGPSLREATDPRRGFDLLQWPCPWDPEKPFELSLEHEVRLKPGAAGSGPGLAAALELCNGRPAAVLLPGCGSLDGLVVRAEHRSAGVQSVDLYYDDADGGAGGIIRRGSTFRERLSAAGFMTWGSSHGRYRPLNAELPSVRMGRHGLTARLEFNWREEGEAVAPASPGGDHPLTLLARGAGIRPDALRPLVRHETVRRKFNFAPPEGAPIFVLNVDWVTAQLVGGSGIASYVDVDLSALQPVTPAILGELDRIAASLTAQYDLAPNPDTKAGRSLRVARGEEAPPVRPRRRANARAPERAELRIGVIGPGKVADRHLAPAIARTAGGRLWSVLGRTPERAEAFAARHALASPAPVKPTLEAFLADPELDAVVVASPDALHAGHVLRAVQSGRHVLCEKPLATDVEDGLGLWTEARKAGLVLAVGYHLRGHPAHRRAAELCRSGRIGRLRHAAARWTYRTADPGNWRSTPAGSRWWAAAAFGTHLLDLLRWVLVPTCGEVLRIRHFRSSGNWRSENDETTISAMELASGATAEATASVGFESASRLEIIGERGTILCEGTLAQEAGGRLWVDGVEETFTARDLYDVEVEGFLAAIRGGWQPEVEAAEGARNVQLLSAGSEP